MSKAANLRHPNLPRPPSTGPTLAGPRAHAQDAPRLEESLHSRATRRLSNINEKRKHAMTTKTNVPDLADLSDERLAREIIINARTMAVSQRDPHGSRPTREEGLRRLASLSATIESQAANLGREITVQLGRGEGDVSLGTLAKFASLTSISDPSNPVWTALSTEVSAPGRPDRGPIWSTDTDLEREGEKSEARNVHAAAQVRSVALADERERRRLVAEAEIEAEQLARFRARSGTS